MLNALSITEVSLHSDYSATGGHELSGGSPAYTRVVPVFTSASGGTLTATGLPYQFDVPSGSVVRWIGLWSGTTFVGMSPNNGTLPATFVVTDPLDGTLHVPTHGFNTGDTVVAWKCAPLDEGVLWTVTATDTDNLTLLGVDLNPPTFTVDTSGFLQLIVTQDFALQGTFAVIALAINANMVG